MGDKNTIDTISQNIESFTDAQNQVLKHSVGNLLVSASAGSGKTRILIEKIVRLILAGEVKLKNLLVVTFTNSASLEIKERLSASLTESGNQKLIAELDNLSTSDILTFDAFCIKVLKEFGYTIGFNDNFSVADETLSSFFKNQALDNIFACHNKELDARFVNFISQFFENRNESDVKNSIVKLYDFLKSKNNDSIYVDKLNDFYNLDLKNPAIVYANNSLSTSKNSAIETLQQLKLKAEMQGENKLADKIGVAISLFENLQIDIIKNFQELANFSLPVMQKNSKDSFEASEIKSQYSTVNKSFKADIECLLPKNIKNLSIEKMQADLKKTKASLEYIFEIVNEFNKEYNLIKSNHRVLDFNDIERLAYKILQDKNITSKIQNRYKWIFIDEYQDTSDLQENIVAKITTGENLLMVGDLKQSIYRFRHAEPKIFINKYDNFKDDQTTNCLIELKTNFRSENSILQFNNFVFDKIYKKSLDDFEYKDNADLEFGGNVKKSTNSPQVALYILDEKSDDENGEDSVVENNIDNEIRFNGVYSVKESPLTFKKHKAIEKQALVLAKGIKQILGKPYYDAKAKKMKYIGYKDIAVLTRAKVGVVLEVRKILKDANIPVLAEYADNIFNSYDMKILLGVLSCLDNQNNDIPFLCTLANIGGLNFNELAEIKSKYSEQKFFYNAVYQYVKDNDDTISHKVKNCFKKLNLYREKSRYLDIWQLVNLIIQKENWENYFAANDYIDEFKSHMQTFEANIQSIKNYDLGEFLNYVNTFLVNVEQNCVIKDSEDAVTLTTIHKSKGLEYPVVYLIGAEKKFSQQSKSQKILMDNDWGISISSFDVETHTRYESVIKKIFKQKIADEEKKEQKRLLYVALTRAKNYLIVIGSRKRDKLHSLKNDYEISHVNNFLDWIVGAMSDQQVSLLTKKEDVVFDLPQGEQFEVHIITENNFNFELKPIKDKTLPEQLYIDRKKFIDILSQKFPHSLLAKKSSVTQIMQENEHYNITDLTYTKSDKNGDDDFLAIGTAYHKFMELLDFCGRKEQMLEQIEKLKEIGKLNEKDFEVVDTSKICDAIIKIYQLVDNGDIVSKEKQFLSYLKASEILDTNDNSKILIQGVADLIIEKENEIYLIDYKTSRLKNEKDFVDRYKLQLDLYAKAIQSFYNKPVTKKLIYSFWLNNLIII